MGSSSGSGCVGLTILERSLKNYRMLATSLTVMVAVLHVVFMVVETFLWTTPNVRRRFGQSAEQAEATRVLAANQGVYNGALAASLLWALSTGNIAAVQMLLGFVIVVGIYGAATAKPSILFVQALPAALALGSSLLGR
jgi:putative membrane protein